jgi:hypothetical protein
MRAKARDLEVHMASRSEAEEITDKPKEEKRN